MFAKRELPRVGALTGLAVAALFPPLQFLDGGAIEPAHDKADCLDRAVGAKAEVGQLGLELGKQRLERVHFEVGRLRRVPWVSPADVVAEPLEDNDDVGPVGGAQLGDEVIVARQVVAPALCQLGKPLGQRLRTAVPPLVGEIGHRRMAREGPQLRWQVCTDQVSIVGERDQPPRRMKICNFWYSPLGPSSAKAWQQAPPPHRRCCRNEPSA
jgi:hypothetical protein